MVNFAVNSHVSSFGLCPSEQCVMRSVKCAQNMLCTAVLLGFICTSFCALLNTSKRKQMHTMHYQLPPSDNQNQIQMRNFLIMCFILALGIS